MSDLVYCPAVELARLIRTRKVSAVEVVDAYLGQIEQHNPAVNAVVTLDAESARQRAWQADDALARGEIWGPLHGVPMTVKDDYETAGMLSTASTRRLADHIPEEDATVVARVRKAGAIILGKTNMSHVGMDIQSNSPIFGRTNNPWNLDRTPGGSSGGSAASIAAGMAALELGNDMAGSLRIPVHFCGVLGIKATHGLVSHAGLLPEADGGSRRIPTVGAGPIARSIDDLRLCLKLIAGADLRDPEVPPVSLDDPPKKRLSDLRIAWTTDFGGVPISADTRSALHQLAANLESAGAVVEQANPPGFDFDEAWATWGRFSAFIVGPELSIIGRTVSRLFAGQVYRKEKTWKPMARAVTAKHRSTTMPWSAAAG
jgi:amidase